MGRPRANKVADWDQVTVRLPPGMRDKINEIAAQNGRSANAEIVARLERSLDPLQSPDAEALRQIVREEVRAALSQAKR
ncbi:hypothetical protein CAL14_05440 [Bordetella genomosp. 9]|uniref:Arc family DNA-binding protein n=1 Tax=Bordetella genomosp. 9 TaxID=1416803 RepID=UPI000A28EC24|nr:Arc family DNA-binding protein [Bordetella genomosp. 9]ARP89798.1 hypothetical protein CAL14_05440 [Bordetella genomosp. 9]